MDATQYQVGDKVSVITWQFTGGQPRYEIREQHAAEVVTVSRSGFPRLVRYQDGSVRRVGYEQGVQPA